MYVSYFIGGPLHRKKTSSRVAPAVKILFKDSDKVIHVYNELKIANNEFHACYRYAGTSDNPVANI